MTVPPFRPGFRISAVDAAVLVAGSAGAAVAAQAEWWMGAVVAFVVGHFFLFCNVFRVARPLELAWAALFLAMAGSTITTGMPGWPATLAASLAATVVVIVVQVRRPSYHGIAWQRINPALPEWWAIQHGEERDERNTG